jgi:hypothetical protein
MPAFKLGGVTPNNVKMGSSQADKIYMGSTLVWEYIKNDTFNTRFNGNFPSTANMSDRDWGATYNMDGLQCFNNLGLAMFFDTSSDATAFMSTVPTAGIKLRVDQDSDYGGPGALRACLKADLTQSGNQITTSSAFGNLLIADMINLGMSPGDLSETFLDFA